MNASPWASLKAIYERLSARTGWRRESLAQAAASGTIANDESDGFLARPAFTFRKQDLPVTGDAPMQSGDTTVTLRAFSAGEILAERFRIVRFIAHGGMGDVYEAEDLAATRRPRVALKTVLPEIAKSPSFIEQFEREIEIGKNITHANVCRVHDMGVHREPGSDGPPILFLTMELLYGETLSKRLESGPMTTAEALPILHQIASGLDAAHAQNIVHRDLKPSNVMLTKARSSNQVRAVITDFGLAQETSDTGSGADPVRGGTPDYMSPEQVRVERLGPASDLYALGVIAYRMVTGELPFDGVTAASRMMKRLSEPPVRPRKRVPSLDPKWEVAILRCLELEPSRRFASSLDFARALEAEGSGQRVWHGLNARKILVAGVVLAILIVGVVWRTWASLQTHRPSRAALVWYEKGVAALQEGTSFTASKALDEAVKLDDRFALAHARLAEAYSDLDDVQRARAEMLRAKLPAARTESLSSLDGLYLDALSYDLSREYGQSVSVYSEIVKRSSDAEKARALVDLGRSYEKNKEISKAVDSYRQAIVQDPEYAAAHLRLGVAYSLQQHLKGAAEALSKAERLYTAMSNTEGVAETLYQRGLIASASGNLAEAVDLFQQSLTQAKAARNTFQQTRALLQLSGAAYKQGRPAEARNDASAALQLAKTNGAENLTARGVIELGSVAQVQGDQGAAERYFGEALSFARSRADARNEARALLALGSLHIQSGQDHPGIEEVDTARKYFASAGVKRNVADALILLGRAKAHAGEYAAALENFEEQLKLGNEIPSPAVSALAHEGLGSVYFALERYPEAVREYRDCYEANRRIGNALAAAYAAYNLGNVYARTGKYGEAQTFLSTARGTAVSGEYGDLMAAIKESEAEMWLSMAQPAKAIAGAREVLHSKAAEPITVTEAQLVITRAFARAGRAGVVLEYSRLEAATLKLKDFWLQNESKLAHTECRFAAGDYRAALNDSLEIRQQARQTGRKESEYRAGMYAAMASKAAGRGAEYGQLGTEAVAALRRFREAWPEADFHAYAARPDVRQLWRKFQRETGIKVDLE